MRGLFRILLLVLCVVLFCQSAFAQADSAIYLRVIAANDSPASMREKLRVRAAVLEVCPKNPLLIPAAMDKIRAAANEEASARVSFRYWSPIQNAPLLPTLYVEVEQAAGHNWFGLLYERSPFLFSEDSQGEITFVWPLLSWLFRR